MADEQAVELDDPDPALVVGSVVAGWVNKTQGGSNETFFQEVKKEIGSGDPKQIVEGIKKLFPEMQAFTNPVDESQGSEHVSRRDVFGWLDKAVKDSFKWVEQAGKDVGKYYTDAAEKIGRGDAGGIADGLTDLFPGTALIKGIGKNLKSQCRRGVRARVLESKGPSCSEIILAKLAVSGPRVF
ncbi:hypothetical protein HRG_001181 [Hirsutella rhossiliensis]|uniref:Uncharacterized protein n=1 Tax=Hirsutella rhossiliensis TaxID=111463 RepID=A0A9P8SNL9_9HYPO|nr:uncharacterized protein HRG_01181 [Hirsutella rhossiliensis]KAH0968539.1 hypothetical protein HRG_01181 [Hirsutella rhossiliensis]